MNAKPILAYDCASVGASIALVVDGRTHTRTLEQSQQAAELLPSIDALLRERGVDYSDLGCIISTVGPGSFTGVRIGLAALHGFVLVTHVPIKLLSTLEAMAWQVTHMPNAPNDFFVSLRAGKGEVYAQAFALRGAAPVATGEIFLASEDKSDWTLPRFTPVVDAAAMASVAEHLPAVTLADAVPLYIRPPDAIAAAPHAWLTQG